MQRIVRLNDGTEYQTDMCGMDDGVLWVHALTTIENACSVFTDKNKTVKIVDTYSGQEDLRFITWDGYTELLHISMIYDGYIQIGLRKGD